MNDNDASTNSQDDAGKRRQPSRSGGPRRSRTRRTVRPEDVRSAQSFTPEQRLLLLDVWMRSKLGASDFAELAGISQHTLYNWKKRFSASRPATIRHLQLQTRCSPGRPTTVPCAQEVCMEPVPGAPRHPEAATRGGEATLGLALCGALARATCLLALLGATTSICADDGRLVEVRLLFPDARLIVKDGMTAEVVIDGPGSGGSKPAPVVIVPSSELTVHRLAPGLFQIVANLRTEPFWRVNALGNTMWAVVNGIIGTDGGGSAGNYMRYPSWVSVVPATREDALAGNVQLRIQDLELVFRPAKKTLVVEGGMLRLSTEKTWEIRQVGEFSFHLRLAGHGDDEYLAVDAGGKEARHVRPGRSFGTAGEAGQVLSCTVQAIRSGGRYARSKVPKLLEPKPGAVLDNGSRTGDKAVWTFRWTPVDGAEYYELHVTGGWKRKVRHPFCVITWRGQGYAQKAGGTWKVRAVREGKPLRWSRPRKFADTEPFDTDLEATTVDYLLPKSDQDKRKRAPPALKRPEAGAVLDNGRADGRDSVSWTFEWSHVRGVKEYEIILVRGGDRAPFLRERVRGTQFEFRSDEYRVFGRPRGGWVWRVRTVGRRRTGRWSEMRRFSLEPLDTDPPSSKGGSTEVEGSEDVPALLTPKPGAALAIPGRKDGDPPKPLAWSFEWKAVPGAEAYDIECGMRGRRWAPKLRKRVEETSFRASTGPAQGMRSGNDFLWRVRAVRDGKPLAWSDLRPFDLDFRKRR